MAKFALVLLLLLPQIVFSDTIEISWDPVDTDVNGNRIFERISYRLYFSADGTKFAMLVETDDVKFIHTTDDVACFWVYATAVRHGAQVLESAPSDTAYGCIDGPGSVPDVPTDPDIPTEPPAAAQPEEPRMEMRISD